MSNNASHARASSDTAGDPAGDPVGDPAGAGDPAGDPPRDAFACMRAAVGLWSSGCTKTTYPAPRGQITKVVPSVIVALADQRYRQTCLQTYGELCADRWVVYERFLTELVLQQGQATVVLSSCDEQGAAYHRCLLRELDLIHAAAAADPVANPAADPAFHPPR
jgi:hypothetical protein